MAKKRTPAEEAALRLRKARDVAFPPKSHVILMLDGRSFSRRVRNKFQKPFDPLFHELMNKTMLAVANEAAGCDLAYTQSDEISLHISDLAGEHTQPWFNNRQQKLCSIAASVATGTFNLWVAKLSPDLSDPDNPFQFDCKAWDVPSPEDVADWFLFRQKDCLINAMEQAAQARCSHKELDGLSVEKQIEKLKEKTGIDFWTTYTNGQKHGRVAVKTKMEKEIFPTGKFNMNKNPLVKAKTDGNGVTRFFVERNVWTAVEATPFKKEDILALITPKKR